MSLFDTPDATKEEESESSEDEVQIDENDNVRGKIGKVEAEKVPTSAVGRSQRRKVAASVEKSSPKGSKVLEEEHNDAIEPAAPKRKPSTQVLVDRALTALNEKYGSSVIAIKKYILSNYPDLVESRLRMQIWKYVRKSIEEGKMKQNKQKFKIIVKEKDKAIMPAKKGATLRKKEVPLNKTVQSKKAATTSKKMLKENLVKVKMPGKTEKNSEQSNSADVPKKQKISKKEKLLESPPSTSNQRKAKNEPKDKGKDKVMGQAKAKPKRALYSDKAVGVVTPKVSKKTVKAKLAVNPSESPLFEKPTTTKRNARKEKAQKTEN